MIDREADGSDSLEVCSSPYHTLLLVIYLPDVFFR
jgi:hypothetical protein